jgi:predicted amidohydrolase YtcJ
VLKSWTMVVIALFVFPAIAPESEGGSSDDVSVSPSVDSAEEGPADLILRFGRIWTGDSERPQAEALAARGGKIIGIGSAAHVSQFRGAKTKLIDRPADFAMPGLIDAHAHLASLGATAAQLDLRGVESEEEVVRRVRVWNDDHPGDGWIRGRGWDESLWPRSQAPLAASLDKVAPNRPVWLRRVDGHSGWANGEAMRRANLDPLAPDPPGGKVLRDTAGQPAGVFIGSARRLITHAIPDDSDADVIRHILAAQRISLRAGLTSVHDANLSRSDAALYRALDREGLLKLRVYGNYAPRSRGSCVCERASRKHQAGSTF